MNNQTRTEIRQWAVALLMSCLLMAIAVPSMAQGLGTGGSTGRVTGIVQNFQTILYSCSVLIVTIAFIWVGYKMIFQHAKWGEVAHIVIGGLIIGGAASFAGWLIPAGAPA